MGLGTGTVRYRGKELKKLFYSVTHKTVENEDDI